jgi:phytoene synthase
VRAFGCSTPAADEVATELGRALQLTNILRDVVEDAERGRLYLPRELLVAQGIPDADPAAALVHPGLPAVCEAVARDARAHFAAASAALKRCPRRPMRPAALMLATYQAVLRHLERRGWHRLAEPVKVPKMHKLWLLVRHGLF